MNDSILTIFYNSIERFRYKYGFIKGKKKHYKFDPRIFAYLPNMIKKFGHNVKNTSLTIINN